MKVPAAAMGLAPIKTHVFVIAPNNSGSTVLRNAIAAAPGCWSLVREGQHVPGFVGSSTRGTGLRLIWASRPEWIARFTDPSAYDWAATARAWRLQAQSGDPDASVLVTSSPPFLFLVRQLREAFPEARFVFLVRNPYAVVEGIIRRASEQPLEPGEDIRAVAARHVMACLRQQRANIAAYQDRSLSLSYEALCADPAAAAEAVGALVPALGALDFAKAAPAKGLYDEPFRDMNPDQIARLAPDDLAAINSVFDQEPGLLRDFGYERLSG